MPAVDYRQPGGMSPDELAIVLAAAMATGRVAGVEVTIYNPTLDPDGTAGAALTEALVRGLERRRSWMRHAARRAPSAGLRAREARG